MSVFGGLLVEETFPELAKVALNPSPNLSTLIWKEGQLFGARGEVFDYQYDLGDGGNGVVRLYTLTQGQNVAIKLLSDTISGQQEEWFVQTMARLCRSCDLVRAAVLAPGVVAMEIGQASLEALEGTLSEEQACAVALSLLGDAECIRASTDHVNMDVKLENCMYNRTLAGLRVFFIDLGSFSLEGAETRSGTITLWPREVRDTLRITNKLPLASQSIVLYTLGIMLLELVLRDNVFLSNDYDPFDGFQKVLNAKNSIFMRKCAYLLGYLPAEQVARGGPLSNRWGCCDRTFMQALEVMQMDNPFLP